MLSQLTIIPPNRDIVSYEGITLTQINKILTNRILLDEDIDWLEFKLHQYRLTPTLCIDMDDKLLYETHQILLNLITIRHLIKINCNAIKINSIKKEYRYHLANDSIPGYCGFELLPQEIKNYIFKLVPFNKRIELNCISKKINKDINELVLPETYISPKKLLGMIKTRKSKANTKLQSNYTLKQLHTTIKCMSEKKKNMIIKKSEIHAFNKFELYGNDSAYISFRSYKGISEKQKKSGVLLMLLLVIIGVIAGFFLPSQLSYCEETGKIKNICSSIGDMLGLSSFSLAILFMLNEIFGSPYHAKRNVFKTTQCFFKQVNEINDSDEFHNYCAEKICLQ